MAIPSKGIDGKPEILTLYKLKCKVADTLVCIIEYIKSNKPDSFSNRVRLYITRGEKTQKTRIKNGLFIRFKPEANGDFKIKDDNFVGFFEINEKGEQTGITYKGTESKKTLSGATVYEIIKNSKIQQLNEKCKSFDSDNKKLVDINVKAAAASYNLFLDDTNGLIATLIKTHETNKNTATYTEKEVMDGLVNEFTDIKSKVKKVLTEALRDVKEIEKNESYLVKMETVFNSFFTPQTSVPLPLSAASPPASSTLTIGHPTLNKHLDNTGFNLHTVADISSTSSTQNFTYKSQDPSIAEVDAKGYVTLRKYGRVNITVDDGTNTKSVTLTVFQQPSGLPPNPQPGGKGKRRRRSTRKYQKRRGRGNGNNGRRRLTRKVKGQSGGGGGGGARRGGKIHRKTKKRGRGGRGGRGGRRGRRGHRRTIKKYHSI